MRFSVLAVVLAIGAAFPAAAEPKLTATGQAVLVLCLEPDLSFEQRLARATALGLTPVTEDNAPAAATALAPYFLVFVRAYGITGPEWSAPVATERVRAGADTELRTILIPSDDRVTSMGANDLVLRLVRIGDAGACVIALPGAEPSDLEAATGLRLRDRSRPPIRMFFNTDRPGPLPAYLAFDPSAFEGTDPSPVVYLDFTNKR